MRELFLLSTWLLYVKLPVDTLPLFIHPNPALPAAPTDTKYWNIETTQKIKERSTFQVNLSLVLRLFAVCCHLFLFLFGTLILFFRFCPSRVWFWLVDDFLIGPAAFETISSS